MKTEYLFYLLGLAIIVISEFFIKEDLIRIIPVVVGVVIISYARRNKATIAKENK